ALNVTYKVPLDDFPFLDWVGVKASYRSSYNWDAASLAPAAQSQGNIIANTQSRQINGDLDFEKLYNYFPYLKKISSRPRPGGSSSGSSGGRSSRDSGGRGGLSKSGGNDKGEAVDNNDKKSGR